MHIHTKIQKWGNGLAIRISGAMREIPHLQNGTEVDVEVSENGLIIQKSERLPKIIKLPFTEKELIQSLKMEHDYTDLLTQPLPKEIGY